MAQNDTKSQRNKRVNRLKLVYDADKIAREAKKTQEERLKNKSERVRNNPFLKQLEKLANSIDDQVEKIINTKI